MKKLWILVSVILVLVVGIVVILVTPKTTHCENLINLAIVKVMANPAVDYDQFKNTGLYQFVMDKNRSVVAKASYLNDNAFLSNRDITEAVQLAQACNTAILDSTKEDHFYFLYGNMAYIGVGPNKDINAWPIMGGFPEKDFHPPIITTRKGESTQVFGTTFFFTDGGKRLADTSLPIDLSIINASYMSKNGYMDVANSMSFLTLNGEILMSQNGKLFIVKIVD